MSLIKKIILSVFAIAMITNCSAQCYKNCLKNAFADSIKQQLTKGNLQIGAGISMIDHYNANSFYLGNGLQYYHRSGNSLSLRYFTSEKTAVQIKRTFFGRNYGNIDGVDEGELENRVHFDANYSLIKNETLFGIEHFFEKGKRLKTYVATYCFFSSERIDVEVNEELFFTNHSQWRKYERTFQAYIYGIESNSGISWALTKKIGLNINYGIGFANVRNHSEQPSDIIYTAYSSDGTRAASLSGAELSKRNKFCLESHSGVELVFNIGELR